jgi:hypothetical protein
MYRQLDMDRSSLPHTPHLRLTIPYLCGYGLIHSQRVIDLDAEFT